MAPVPATRVRRLNDGRSRTDGRYVLYWMTASRRTRFNFGLQHAVERARVLERPLVVLEALRCDYPWAGERFHRFVIDGMRDNAFRLRRAGVLYHPYVEPEPDDAKGLLAAFGDEACEIVTDDYPAFMLPRMIETAARRVPVSMVAVDSNGLLPMDAADRAFPTAHAFRRFLQRELREHLIEFPRADPLARHRLPGPGELPDSILRRWPAVPLRALKRPGDLLAALPLDRAVGSTGVTGGPRAARMALDRFLDRLDGYAEDRNRVEIEATSGLSPYLHFGHVSSHEVCAAILDREAWTIDALSESTAGSRAGWWGIGESAEAFLDQLVTWRELGFNMCRHRPDHERFSSLPDWSRRTLAEHRADPREPCYSRAEFEGAETHDPLWNAAQRQLVREGTIHNYLRMLWGKKILHWSADPETALDTMIELNNRYALDGRDPNSYSGIFWVLGRYDRAWGPERPIFGKVRYMTSENTARKMNVRPYLERFAPDGVSIQPPPTLFGNQGNNRDVRP